MRQLNADEKKFALKNVDSSQVIVDHLKLLVEYNDFMVDKMLYSNYLEKRRGYVKQTKEFKDEIAEKEAIIEITGRQVTEGVEIQTKTGIGAKKMVGVD